MSPTKRSPARSGSAGLERFIRAVPRGVAVDDGDLAGLDAQIIAGPADDAAQATARAAIRDADNAR